MQKLLINVYVSFIQHTKTSSDSYINNYYTFQFNLDNLLQCYACESCQIQCLVILHCMECVNQPKELLRQMGVLHFLFWNMPCQADLVTIPMVKCLQAKLLYSYNWCFTNTTIGIQHNEIHIKGASNVCYNIKMIYIRFLSWFVHLQQVELWNVPWCCTCLWVYFVALSNSDYSNLSLIIQARSLPNSITITFP